MAIFGTGGIKAMPNQIADGIVDQVQSGSAIGVLSQQKAMRFGDVSIVTFENRPRAEFVGEGVQKSSTTGSFGTVTAVPHKVQVTMRFNQEVQWADADYQLGIINKLATEGAKALSRALDLGVFYRLNPLTGKPITAWTNYLDATDKRVARTASPDVDVEEAIGLILDDKEGWDVNGIAMSREFAFSLATLKDTQKRPLYPELGYGVTMNSFKGIPASVTTTVNAPEFTEPAEGENYTVPKVGAIVGDWKNGIYWGVQRNLPLETITYGDPDGQGDLRRTNQIALRLEILYAWYVFTDRFAVIEGDTATTKAGK
ncbi:phage major capsid protein [Bifidobacterium amazonense]|uniref:Phage major capsid protein n=1 Tax=Bifidobacterium amazonense TaxID=2809027 RepID=A0ABS9VSD4_9BIFI|nr:phage major capsid protein [Bifidobacterium amazonense]MCH9274995.1 phage major capsid protein [Bifidobacterium amazonense]